MRHMIGEEHHKPEKKVPYQSWEPILQNTAHDENTRPHKTNTSTGELTHNISQIKLKKVPYTEIAEESLID